MTLKSIGVLSMAKIFGLLYAGLGLIIGAIVSLFALVGGAAMMAGGGDHGGLGGGVLGMFLGVGAISLFPLFYGCLGFIGGAIWAFLYNLVAGFTGGIELNLVARS
jgi:hypothetical protein